MPDPTLIYRGRFAPSPSGPLHLGSLIAALASYLDARHHAGIWLVRIDDLDPPREQAGAAQEILQSLENHGLQWDEDIMWQSQRAPAYEEALAKLANQHRTFQCDCSRHQLNSAGSCQAGCQSRQGQIATPSATRIIVMPSSTMAFDDQLQGPQGMQRDEALENFVVKRKDGLYAYQLAVVVDDASQRINHIVRGSDLMDSTGRQIYLQQTLGLDTPSYCHLPVITNRDGQKFSKQNHAPAIVNRQAVQNLRLALAFLRQSQPPAELKDTRSLLNFAIARWSPTALPGVMDIPASAISLSG